MPSPFISRLAHSHTTYLFLGNEYDDSPCSLPEILLSNLTRPFTPPFLSAESPRPLPWPDRPDEISRPFCRLLKTRGRVIIITHLELRPHSRPGLGRFLHLSSRWTYPAALAALFLARPSQVASSARRGTVEGNAARSGRTDSRGSTIDEISKILSDRREVINPRKLRHRQSDGL